MSQEHLELIRRSYEALNDRDFERLVQNFDPKVELYLIFRLDGFTDEAEALEAAGHEE